MTLTTEQLKHILDNPDEFSLSQVQEMAVEILSNRALATTKAISDVIAERQLQQDKGRDNAHDDGYIDGVLALAGAAFAVSGAGFNRVGTYRLRARNLWPFPKETFKPAGDVNRRHDLVRGAAMIIAEIDKMDRATALEATNA